MGKEHDSWLNGLGLDIAGKKYGGTVNKVPGGLNLGVKWEKKVNAPPKKFLVGPVPCFAKPSLRFAVEGAVEATRLADKWKVSGGIAAVGAGTLDIGPGVATKDTMIGAVGTLELSANAPVAVSYDGALPEADRWSVQTPLDVVIRGSGKIALKAEDAKRGSVALTIAAASWELYIVTLASWNGSGFDVVTVRDGKDMVRLKQAIERPGPVIEDAVDRNAPRAVKDGAVGAVAWTASSPVAGAVADGTGAVLGGIGKVTGTDPGKAVVRATAYLSDQNADEPREIEERLAREAEIGNATGHEFWTLMAELELAPGKPLAAWRTADEWNAVHDLLNEDARRMQACQMPTDAWKDAARKLAETARARRHKKQQQDAEAVRRKQDDAAAKALAAMEASRLAAMGPANVVNNRTADCKDHPARRYFEKGWPLYAAAEALRKQARAAQGDARIDLAQQASAQYAKAQVVFQAGVARLPAKAAQAA